jgi:hypothetical protein
MMLKKKIKKIFTLITIRVKAKIPISMTITDLTSKSMTFRIGGENSNTKVKQARRISQVHIRVHLTSQVLLPINLHHLPLHISLLIVHINLTHPTNQQPILITLTVMDIAAMAMDIITEDLLVIQVGL